MNFAQSYGFGELARHIATCIKIIAHDWVIIKYLSSREKFLILSKWILPLKVHATAHYTRDCHRSIFHQISMFWLPLQTDSLFFLTQEFMFTNTDWHFVNRFLKRMKRMLVSFIEQEVEKRTLSSRSHCSSKLDKKQMYNLKKIVKKKWN